MKKYFILFISMLYTFPAQAQEVTNYPICSQIINEADHSVRGSISTARSNYTNEGNSLTDGTQARHSSNFNLAPFERMDICSSGPFYEGRRLELTLRTLIPVFNCYTSLDAPIIINSKRDADGELRIFATCY